MKITVLTLFPAIIQEYFNNSIMAKSMERGLISLELINIRDFAMDKHKTCDDAPYGGGAGMVLKPEPLARALLSVNALNKRTIYPSPSGKLFNQNFAKELSKLDEIVLICGRYEGIDQRIIDLYVDDEISIGDYVLSSGEISSLVIIDTIYRLIDGVISQESLVEESFNENLLEFPQYTRPEVFENLRVPEILLSGHHANIIAWRKEMSFKKTSMNRPDLLKK